MAWDELLALPPTDDRARPEPPPKGAPSVWDEWLVLPPINDSSGAMARLLAWGAEMDRQRAARAEERAAERRLRAIMGEAATAWPRR